MNLNLYLSSIREKGYLAYEYNPFHNYQTDVDLYKITCSDSSTFIVPKYKAVNLKNGNILNKKTQIINGSPTDVWVDQNGNIIDNADVIPWNESGMSEPWATAGSVIDFETDQLNFDLDHPVDIEVQPSYDGSPTYTLLCNSVNKNVALSQFRYEVSGLGNGDTKTMLDYDKVTEVKKVNIVYES